MQSGQSFRSVPLRLLAGLALLATTPGTSSAAPGPRLPDPPAPTGWQAAQEVSHAGITGHVIVYLPARYRAGGRHPLVIALHGWNSPVEDWQRQSRIASLADSLDAVVACPDMGKTVYETRYYDSYRLSDRRTPRMPGTPWIGDVVVPWMRKRYFVSADPTRTAIVGYSTGGRGAVLVAQTYPAFSFVAGLSGTYDLVSLKSWTGEYRIHAAWLGPRSTYPERWVREQSIERTLVARLKGVKVFLAHGTKDRVVPMAQTRALEGALRRLGAPPIRWYPAEAHDWVFWRPALRRALEAFRDHLATSVPRRPTPPEPDRARLARERTRD
jgi:enterochelin esterase-like enzyme